MKDLNLEIFDDNELVELLKIFEGLNDSIEDGEN